MNTPDIHDAHGDVDLSLTETTADGGKLFQSWTICACNLDGLRARLGAPHQESVHTAETVQATAAAVLSIPGVIHHGEGL